MMLCAETPGSSFMKICIMMQILLLRFLHSALNGWGHPTRLCLIVVVFVCAGLNLEK